MFEYKKMMLLEKILLMAAHFLFEFVAIISKDIVSACTYGNLAQY